MVPKTRLISGCSLTTFAVALLGTALSCLAAQPTQPYGIAQRTATKPFLSMPERADGLIPPLLSQTGAFTDTPNMVPAPGLIPYDLVVPFWSDGAGKERWMAAPDRGTIKF